MWSILSTIAVAIHGVFDRLWTAACGPLIAILNLFFRPDKRTGDVALWKVALWLAANAAILYFAVSDLTIQPLFWSLVAFLVVHILIMLSCLRIMYEEKRVMEGSLKPQAMTFSAFDAVNNMSVLISSVVFYILGLAAMIQTIERWNLATILRQRPSLFSDYTEYLTCVLNEIPIVNVLIAAWANLAEMSDNLAAEIVYAGIPGNSARVFIAVTISVVVLRALLLRFQQWSQQVAIAYAIEEGKADPESVKERLVRMPTTLHSHLMRSALRHPETSVRRRALTAMAKLDVPHFARDFLLGLDRHLERETGLSQISESLSKMSAQARDAMSKEIGPIVEKQMTAVKDVIDEQTRGRLEEIHAKLKPEPQP
jgi:hypothetical protein